MPRFLTVDEELALEALTRAPVAPLGSPARYPTPRARPRGRSVGVGVPVLAPGEAPPPPPPPPGPDIDNYIVRSQVGGLPRLTRSARITRAGVLRRIHGQSFIRSAVLSDDGGLLFYLGSAAADTGTVPDASESILVTASILGVDDLGGVASSIRESAAGFAVGGPFDLHLRVSVARDQRFAVRNVISEDIFAVVFEVEVG